MGSIHKKLKQIHPLYHIDKSLFNDLHPMGTQAEAQLDARKASEKALKTAEAEDPIPLPDDEAIQRDARRAASRRKTSGSASTFMSSEYGFGG